MYPKLNFPQYAFRMRSFAGSNKVWDELRRVWLVLTPEEWVRRHVVRWLTDSGVLPVMIVQEYPVCVQGQPQRADIVVFGKDARPFLLVECKEPKVDMTGSVYAQAVRYNAVVGARYIMLTNGLKHSLYECSGDGEYVPVRDFANLWNVYE